MCLSPTQGFSNEDFKSVKSFYGVLRDSKNIRFKPVFRFPMLLFLGHNIDGARRTTAV